MLVTKQVKRMENMNQIDIEQVHNEWLVEGTCGGCCLRRAESNANEQRSRSELCERVIRREATENEEQVYIQ